MLKHLLICLLTLMAVSAFSGGVKTVTITGMGSSKDEALSAALRDAVRNGAGVTVYSETEVKNHALNYDAIFERCLGHVESYRVISYGYDSKQKMFLVEIEAKVSKKMLQLDNAMAMKLLIKRKGSPKIWIEAKENIIGLKQSMGTLADKILKEIASDMGLNVINMENFKELRNREQQRAAILGDTGRAQRKKLILNTPYDLKISVRSEGEVSDLYKNEGTQKQVRDVSLNTHLQAFWADSSETLAVMSLQGIFFNGRYYRNANRNFFMTGSLTRVYLKELLNGENEEAKSQITGKNTKDARAFFRKIALKWIAELDLGVTVRLEIEKISLPLLKDVMKKLQGMEQISGVRLANYDARDYSVIEFESRREIVAVADALEKVLKSRHEYERGTPRRIVFVSK